MHCTIKIVKDVHIDHEIFLDFNTEVISLQKSGRLDGDSAGIAAHKKNKKVSLIYTFFFQNLANYCVVGKC